MRFTIAAAALLTGLAVFSGPAAAQTLFGEFGKQQPRDRVEWANLLRNSASRQSRAALLQAPTVSSSNTAKFVIVMAQGGTIVDVRADRSSGNPFMDHALRNSIMAMPPDAALHRRHAARQRQRRSAGQRRNPVTRQALR